MAKTTHPAMLVAQCLWDNGRDLESHEQTLLTEVHLIGSRRAKTIGIAVREFGDLTKAYHATVFLANRKEADDLTRALEVYQIAVDAQDEGEEIESVPELQAAE